MKRLFLATLVGVMTINTAWAAEPSLLVYTSPDRYGHPTVVGVAPLYTRWVDYTVIAEDAASRALARRFSNVGACEAGKTADLIAWVNSRLVYNPASSTYYAKLKVQLHRGDGQPLATYKAEGEQFGQLTSIYQDNEVGKAFDAAMQNIMTQIQADSALQSSIQTAMAADFTRSPCGIVSIVGREPKFSFFEYF
ncbi:MAG: hypothetical protein K8Q92_05290 [Methylophilales bacterium]|nr:hypothetical protein [Methylophilales bacterium]